MADDSTSLNPPRPWPFVVEEFPADEVFTGSRVDAAPDAPAESENRKEAN